jgi:L-lysine 6-transaminase
MVDMKRFKKILEIIEKEKLVSNCETMGMHLQSKLNELAVKYPDKVSNARGLGLFCAFDAKDSEMRNSITAKALENDLMILGCGQKSVRFRPPVNITADEIDTGIGILDKVISQL